MEIPDIHVRVLFDFEYPTKDGKKVTIKEGEKLYLIKKTNEDWWQVIRNSGRPFYVPASYVEEISRTGTKNDRKFDTVKEFITPKSQAPADTYRMRSSSVDTQPTHDKIKPVIPKRTIFDTQRIHNRESISVITPNTDYKDDDVDYVNIDKQNLELNVHSEISVNKTNHDLDKSASLSSSNSDVRSNNVSNIITSDDDTYTNGYSHVNIKSRNVPTVDNQLPINLSNSLEELTKEIANKTRIIGNAKSDTSYSRIDTLVESIRKDIPVSAKNINEAGNSGLKQVNNNCESFLSRKNDNELKNKLQYSGSFKTKHEREKWAKNFVMQSMREEEFQQIDNSPIENDIPAIIDNDSNNNLNNIASSIAKLSTDNLNNTSTIKSDSSSGICKSDNGDVDSVKSDKNCDAKISSPVTNEDKIDVHISMSSSISDNNDRHMKNYFDSSTEDLDKNPGNWSSSRLTPSDKGSTDSLLDVDTQYSVPEELSICTTASDSLLHTSDTSEDGLSGILREEPSPDDNQHRKKPALKRNKRVESCRLRFPIRGVTPPVPEDHQQPTRELFNGWCEYTYTDGRTFFYNSRTGEKSWKPPRRRCNTDDKNSKLSGSTCYLYSDSSSPLAEVDEHHGDVGGGGGGVDGDDSIFDKDSFFNDAPKGWRIEVDNEKGCKCFVNLVTGAKWFYSIDDEGRVYYFEENSTESSWTLPAAGTSAFNFNEKLEDQSQQSDHVYSNLPLITRSSVTSNENTVTATDNSRNRAMKSKSMILMEPKGEEAPVFSSQKWPQLWNGQMCILKEGILNRTKITENAKRIRKNWTSSYVALTELSLLFFKDHKSFTAWKTNGGQQPEMCVDLNGALIDRGDKVSSRKNVYMISTLLGLQVLIQNDSTQQADLWLEAIQSVIKKLPFGSDSYPRLTRSPPANADDAVPENESKKFYKVTRSKSVKAKNKDGSMEDLTVSPAERQTKIKAKLKKFFHRRPTMESLVKKGIWKDEPAFGCFLSQVAGNETPRVPLFVQRCINCIEKNEENMKTDGLYRASGNLSQVQKIRLQVDQNNLSVIEEEEDVHVLTGALKLFFRELKEPLIPYQLFQKAIKAGHNNNKKEKISQFREIVKALPPANYDTLKFLLQHLLRISKYQEFNRMHIPNIAIVFGPTLMWPEQESHNMALDLMQQNLVIECLLVEYDNIFR